MAENIVRRQIVKEKTGSLTQLIENCVPVEGTVGWNLNFYREK